MNAYYTYVKRASAADKQVMMEIAESHNELAEYAQLAERYSVERNTLIVRYEDGSKDSTGFVRCSKCGAIRDLWEGQIEFCDSCGVNWDD